MKCPSGIPSEYDLVEFSKRLSSKDAGIKRDAIAELKEIGESLRDLDIADFKTLLTGSATDEPLCIVCLGFVERPRSLPEREALQCLAATRLVEQFPDSIAHDELMEFTSSAALRQMAAAWNKVVSLSPRHWMWYKRAASIQMRIDLSKAEELLLSARLRWPGKSDWAKMLGTVYLRLASHKDPAKLVSLRRRSLSEFRLCLRLSHEREFELLVHYCCAGLAYSLSEFEIVERSAISLIKMANLKTGCQTGRSAHPGHTFLGLCFLKRGLLQKSVEQLFASIKQFHGSHVSATTPFETVLAQALLEHGCQAEVLLYLKNSRQIWDRGTVAKIDEWIHIIEGGGVAEMRSGFEVFATHI